MSSINPSPLTKGQIRTAMKAFLAGISPEERHARSLAACHNLLASKEFKHAQTIMIFLSMPAEIETSTLAVKAWQECKTIVVPRMDWATHRMDAVEVKSLDVGLTTSVAGIREPATGTAMSLGMIDMIVIPGLAFDRKGFRVGRGKGFYDRFLAQQDFKGTRCALCFHEQLQKEHIPCEPHDVAMNLIVTDQEVLHCPVAGHPGSKKA